MLENEAEWDRWLRDFVGAIKGAMNRPESIPDAVVELAAEHFERKLPRFRVELRATLDHVASLVFYRTPLALLLEKAQQGKFDALETLLRIDPALEVRSWVGDLMGSAVSAEGAQATQRFHMAVSQGLSVRQNKLLEIGTLLLLLWLWRGRLTTGQRRGFLKDLGVQNVPSKEALREYERCLGVKALYAGWACEDEPKGAALTPGDLRDGLPRRVGDSIERPHRAGAAGGQKPRKGAP